MNPKPLPDPPKIDWFRVIVNLERAGHSQRDIAFFMGMSQPWVKHLKNSPGAMPRYSDGVKLLKWWCDVMDKPLSEVPEERVGIYA